MKQLLKNKRAGFTDLFLFMIIAFVVLLFSGIFIYLSHTVTDEFRGNIADMEIFNDNGQNGSQTLEDTLGVADASFNALTWISVLLIFGMIIAIFIGSYMVTTKPIFFIPYIFVAIIAVIVAVPMSNAYETLALNPTLTSTYSGFDGSNWIMAQLPIIIAIVGITGGIIMFVRMGKREEQYYGY